MALSNNASVAPSVDRCSALMSPRPESMASNPARFVTSPELGGAEQVIVPAEQDAISPLRGEFARESLENIDSSTELLHDDGAVGRSNPHGFLFRHVHRLEERTGGLGDGLGILFATFQGGEEPADQLALDIRTEGLPSDRVAIRDMDRVVHVRLGLVLEGLAPIPVGLLRLRAPRDRGRPR